MVPAIQLSKKAKRLFDRGELDEVFEGLAEQSALWYLGKSESNKGGLGTGSPLDRGFAKSTTRVKKYPKYNPIYAMIRKKRPWLVQSGDLFKYVQKKAQTFFTKSSFTIIVPVNPKGEGPESYAGIHQNGSSKMPQRKYLDFDNIDIKAWRRFARNFLVQHLGSRNFRV